MHSCHLGAATRLAFTCVPQFNNSPPPGTSCGWRPITESFLSGPFSSGCQSARPRQRPLKAPPLPGGVRRTTRGSGPHPQYGGRPGAARAGAGSFGRSRPPGRDFQWQAVPNALEAALSPDAVQGGGRGRERWGREPSSPCAPEDLERRQRPRAGAGHLAGQAELPGDAVRGWGTPWGARFRAHPAPVLLVPGARAQRGSALRSDGLPSGEPRRRRDEYGAASARG